MSPRPTLDVLRQHKLTSTFTPDMRRFLEVYGVRCASGEHWHTSYSCPGKRSQIFLFSTPFVYEVVAHTKEADGQTDGHTGKTVLRPIRTNT